MVYGLGSVYGGMAAALALLARMLIITPLQIRGLNAAIGLRLAPVLRLQLPQRDCLARHGSDRAVRVVALKF